MGSRSGSMSRVCGGLHASSSTTSRRKGTSCRLATTSSFLIRGSLLRGVQLPCLKHKALFSSTLKIDPFLCILLSRIFLGSLLCVDRILILEWLIPFSDKISLCKLALLFDSKILIEELYLLVISFYSSSVPKTSDFKEVYVKSYGAQDLSLSSRSPVPTFLARPGFL